MFNVDQTCEQLAHCGQFDRWKFPRWNWGTEPKRLPTHAQSCKPITRPKDFTPTMQNASQSLPTAFGLPALFASARHAAGFLARTTPGYDEPRIYPKAPAVVGTVRLADAFPAPSTDQVRSFDIKSTQRSAGTTQTLNHAIMAASRVVQAGARLIAVNPAPTPIANDAQVVAWTNRPTRFEVVTAPGFSIVADGDDAETSALPILGSQIEWPDAASHAISFTLTRREQKDRTDADLEFIVARSLALGLARLCDGVLLKGILSKAPGAFTLAKVAAQGLHFSELRAMCGSDAQGAALGADGVLRVLGVNADMTDVIEPSVIGVFGRTAVAVEDEIRIVIKRTSTHGDMEITVFATVEPLVPTSDFWVAA